MSDPDFLIHARLGTGTTGAVFRATRKTDGHQLSLKALSPDTLASMDFGAVQRQIVLLQKAHHPALPKNLDALVLREDPVLVREYIRGIELASLVAGTPVPERSALQVTAAVSSALCAVLDQTGLTHGDVKPSNVFIDLESQVKLVDFGLSTSERDNVERTLTMFYGSVGFMSPECADRNPHQQSDVYSVGLLLAWMLTGVMPRRTSINPRRHKARRKALVTLLQKHEVSEPIRDLIHQCTEYKPADRPTMHEVHAVVSAHSDSARGAPLLTWAGPLINGLVIGVNEVVITDHGQSLSQMAEFESFSESEVPTPTPVVPERLVAPPAPRPDPTQTLLATALFVGAAVVIVGGMLWLAIRASTGG